MSAQSSTAMPHPHSVQRRKRQPSIITQTRSTPRPGALYPLTAIHLGQTIDLDIVSTKIPSLETGKQTLRGKNSLVLELEDRHRRRHTATNSSSKVPEPPQFIALFRFGSVVAINIPPQELSTLLDTIRQHVTDPVKPGSEKQEYFGVMLQPSDLYGAAHSPPTTNATRLMQQQSHLIQQHQPHQEEEATESSLSPVVTGDYCIVESLDLNGVVVISNIMAQTVALDTYNDTADNLLNKFADINSTVRASGKLQTADKGFLFKSVAQNNAIFIDMISKIRLKDRAETAWRITKYEDIHYGLKAEFEIDDRFDQIEYKLNLIQHNSKFFLEVMDSEKSNSLEWTIVWLIGVECILMCVDMSGMGEGLFAYLFSGLPSWPVQPS